MIERQTDRQMSLCLCVCVDEEGMKSMGLCGCEWVCRWQLSSWEAEVRIHEREEDVRTFGGSAGPLWGQAQAEVAVCLRVWEWQGMMPCVV